LPGTEEQTTLDRLVPQHATNVTVNSVADLHAIEPVGCRLDSGHLVRQVCFKSKLYLGHTTCSRRHRIKAGHQFAKLGRWRGFPRKKRQRPSSARHANVQPVHMGGLIEIEAVDVSQHDHVEFQALGVRYVSEMTNVT